MRICTEVRHQKSWTASVTALALPSEEGKVRDPRRRLALEAIIGRVTSRVSSDRKDIRYPTGSPIFRVRVWVRDS